MRSLVLLVPLAALCSNSRPHNVEFAGERPIRVSLKRIKKTDREITRGQLGHFSLITPRYTHPGAVREGNAVTASYVPREFPVRRFVNHPAPVLLVYLTVLLPLSFDEILVHLQKSYGRIITDRTA